MIKLNAGFSKKVGEPNYGSRGASVNVDLEVESALMDQPDQLQERIRKLFLLARKAVDEELNGNGNGNGSGNGNATSSNAAHEAPQDADASCSACGETISDKVAEYSKSKLGRPLCYRCQKSSGKQGRKQ